MPQPKKAPRFGNSSAHHNVMMANLATELIRHGRIRTTHAKAKTVQPIAERMITFAKRGDVHARRQVLQVIRDKDVVHKLFTDVGPAFAERDGGYTRVLKLGPRKGDAAPMALIELVEGISVDGEGGLDEAPRRRWSLRRRQGTQSTTARERSEERAAAVDRGEDPDLAALDTDVEGTDIEHTDQGGTDQGGTDAGGAGVGGTDAGGTQTAGAEPTADDRVEADPAEVEARLAAEDDTADEQATDAGSDASAAATQAEDDEK